MTPDEVNRKAREIVGLTGPLPPQGPPTICRCGRAKSYHEERFSPGHQYEPRYEPTAWREGYRAAVEREAASPALDVERLIRAGREHNRAHLTGDSDHRYVEGDCLRFIAAEYARLGERKPIFSGDEPPVVLGYEDE